MTSIQIRPMARSDLRAVMTIERASFSTPWTMNTFRGLLDRSDSFLFVAEAETEQGTELVGYAVFWRVGDQAEVGDVAVHPGWRRRRIGARLLEHVIAEAGVLGIRELFLEVRESNVAARALYRQYGFVRVGQRRDYYSSPREDALVLARTSNARERAGVADDGETGQTG